MTRKKYLEVLVGGVVAAGIFWVLASLVGINEFVHRVSTADTQLSGLLLLVIVGWLVAWSLSLYTILAALDRRASVFTSILVFASAMCVNNLTPFGQAGGEPITAYLISEVTGSDYETGLAAIAGVDTLNFFPSIALALVGFGYLVIEHTLGRRIELVAASLVVLGVGIPTFLYIGWRRRYVVHRYVTAILVPVVKATTRVLRLPIPSDSHIKNRITGFFASIERLVTDPRALTVALGFSTVGWLFQMLGLWIAFRSIGAPVPFSVIAFVIPIGALAGLTPLPGGAGGIEATLTFLLVLLPFAAVTYQEALTAVILFRGIVYWLPVVFGGTVLVTVAARVARRQQTQMR